MHPSNEILVGFQKGLLGLVAVLAGGDYSSTVFASLMFVSSVDSLVLLHLKASASLLALR